MKRPTPVHVACLLTAALGASPLAQNNEEFARRQYDSGLTFLQNHRDAEALKDLQAVVDSFATSSVADNALLRIAEYQLDTAHDVEAAQAAIDKLLKDYPDADAAPMAHVLAGRVTFNKGRTAADVDAALASFERVPRLFPGNEAVAAAGYYAGETLRTIRRDADALERYRRVTMEFPRSVWAARASLSAGYCLLQQNRPTQALQEFQRARQLFPNSAVATDALNLNTIVYRLYMRAPAAPAFTFSGKGIGPERSEFRDAVGIRFDQAGQVMLGHRNGVVVFKADGTIASSVAAQDASAFFVDEQGRIVIARNGALVVNRGDTIAYLGPDSDGQLKAVDEIPAAMPDGRGQRLIANPKGRNVLRAETTGKFTSVFATGQITRMARNWQGDLALLDRGTKSVAVVDANGKAVHRIATKGTGWEFDQPIDVTFDQLGHLYVLDRGRSSIFIFGATGKLVTTLTIPGSSPGSLSRAEALAVDPAGRLLVFDERARRIQVYQ